MTTTQKELLLILAGLLAALAVCLHLANRELDYKIVPASPRLSHSTDPLHK